MQKRSFHVDDFRYDHISLPSDFPVSLGDHYALEERRITYLHYHDHPEIGICHEGSGVFILDSIPRSFSPGDVTFIPSGRYHLATSTPKTKTIWSYITFESDKLFKYSPADSSTRQFLTILENGPSQIISQSEQKTGFQNFQKLIYELNHKEPAWQDAVESCIRCIIIDIGRLMPATGMQISKQVPTSYSRLLPAFEYITSHYQEDINAEDLADISNLSVSHLRRLFRNASGLSPMQYLNKVRVEAAGRLMIHSDSTFLTISLETGFTSLSSFNRQFKALTGGTPNQWKKDHEY